MDRFKSSTFYPDHESESKMMDCIQSDIPVFTEDLFENKGHKRFFACGYEHFITNVYKTKYGKSTKSKPPCLYEMLQYDLPTKIYFDFDQPAEKGDCSELVIEFLYHVRKEVEKAFKVENVEMIVLDSCSDRKYSFHVIVQIFLENVPMVRSFVANAMDSFDNTDIYNILDTTVYSRNRSFRLIYSSKLGRTNKLINKSKEEDERYEYNEKDIILSLIQNKLPDHYTGELLPFMSEEYINANRIVHSMNGNVSIKSSDETQLSKDDLPEKMINFLELNGGVLKTTKISGDFLSCIIGKTKCPFIKGFHKHNNQFFTFNRKTFTGWFSCPDDTCPDIVYKKQSFAWAFA